MPTVDPKFPYIYKKVSNFRLRLIQRDPSNATLEEVYSMAVAISDTRVVQERLSDFLPNSEGDI